MSERSRMTARSAKRKARIGLFLVPRPSLLRVALIWTKLCFVIHIPLWCCLKSTKDSAMLLSNMDRFPFDMYTFPSLSLLYVERVARNIL